MYDLNRFLVAQEAFYNIAKKELIEGKKKSHWIWFIFPQLKGLGFSYNSNYYGIDGKEETLEYYTNSILKEHLIELVNILLDSKELSIVDIMGEIDALKLKSSMTLFFLVTKEKMFKDILDKYYGGELDEFTLNKLK